MSEADAVAVPRKPARARRAPKRPPRGAWREQALAEISARRQELDHLRGNGLDKAAADRIAASLDAAYSSAHDEGPRGWRRLSSWLKGTSVESTWGDIDAAGEALLRDGPEPYVAGQLARVLRRVRKSLDADDPRRVQVEQLVAKRDGASLEGIGQGLVELLAEEPACSEGVVQAIARLHSPRELSSTERAAIVTAVHAADRETRRTLARVRSFRNMLLACAVGLTVTAAGLAALGFAKPRIVPLCFAPENQVVCPTGVAETSPGPASGQESSAQSSGSRANQDGAARATAHQSDLALIELLGLVAASVAAAAALRNAKGTSTPYAVPIAVAVLKLPTGALTAVLGLLLMRGQFIPGLSALDSPAQIVAWAILFGYAQQLFTRFVDQRAQTVLDAAGPRSQDAPAPAT